MMSLAVAMICVHCKKSTMYTYWHGGSNGINCNKNDMQTVSWPHTHAYCDNPQCGKDWIVRDEKE
jgi:hypothetical protein